MSRAGLFALTLVAASVAVALVVLIAYGGRARQATATGAGSPAVIINPSLASLWLCNTGAAACTNKAGGVEERNLDVDLMSAVTSPNPNCSATPTATPTAAPTATPTPCATQEIGAFEFDLLYNSKVVSVTPEPGDVFGPTAICGVTPGEGTLHVRCPASGTLPSGFGPGTLTVLHTRPTADDYTIIIAGQQNGISTNLVLQSCQLIDTRNKPIKSDVCGNASVIVRYLEGDVEADCTVDVVDQQQVAFRWGVRLGHLLYQPRFDFDPSVFPDGDIDAKDLQFVFGRHGSRCTAPLPSQPP